ncbi:unnamed protein product [Pylaiella littoralis]
MQKVGVLHSSSKGGGLLVPLLLLLLLFLVDETRGIRGRSLQQQAHQRSAMNRARVVILSGCRRSNSSSSSSSVAFCSSPTWSYPRLSRVSSKNKGSCNLGLTGSGGGCGGGGDSISDRVLITAKSQRDHRRSMTTAPTRTSTTRAAEDVKVMKAVAPAAASPSAAQGGQQQQQQQQRGGATAATALATAIEVPGEPAEAASIDSPTRSKAARAYYDRRREAMGAWAKERRGRDLCEKCRRARKMCLCCSLPERPLPTSTRFVILQHPAETKKRITGTVPLLLHCLANCRRVVMRSEYSEEDLKSVLGIESGGSGGTGDGRDGVGDQTSLENHSETSSKPLLLFPCPGAEFLEDIAASRNEAAAGGSPGPRPSSWRPASSAGVVVVLIDGTWSQAKQILSRYPFLSPKPPSATGPASMGGGGGGVEKVATSAFISGTTADGVLRTAERGSVSRVETGGEGGGLAGKRGDACCRAVQFRSAGVSSYGFRREPSKECLSTLESVAYTLEVLEGTPEGVSAAAYLRKSFAAMVAMQIEAAGAAESSPRYVNRKARTANRRSTPKKNKTEPFSRRLLQS